MRLFTTVMIPKEVSRALKVAREVFADDIGSRISQERWHITLDFIGERGVDKKALESLKDPLLLDYMPTVQITHLGSGGDPNQLWAYIHRTPSLMALRRAVREYISAVPELVPDIDKRKYVPHINLGTFTKSAKNRDFSTQLPLSLTFRVDEVVLMESVTGLKSPKYNAALTMPLSA